MTPFLRRMLTVSALSLLSVVTLYAQGGPPFRTDDPETPGNKHWEVNFGFIGDRNPDDGDYEVPDFDINYGLGDRIQLKYEIPIAIAEELSKPASGASPAQPGHVLGGLGESLLGVKWRFYQHHPGDPWIGRNTPSLPNRRAVKAEKKEAEITGATPPEEPFVDFSVSTYPQLSLDNPTRAVPRGVVDPGPDFLLPLEVNARLGPIRIDGEVGYHFGNRELPQRWIRGLIIGHEFSERTEAYAELYDLQDANRVGGNPKERETTLGLGGRLALNKERSLLLLLMGGRSFQKIAATNSQPSWIAYVGLQVTFGPHPVTPEVQQKLPNESKPKDSQHDLTTPEPATPPRSSPAPDAASPPQSH